MDFFDVFVREFTARFLSYFVYYYRLCYFWAKNSELSGRAYYGHTLDKKIFN